MRTHNLLALSLALSACTAVGDVFGPRADAESSEATSAGSEVEESASELESEGEDEDEDEDEGPIDATDVGTGADGESEWGETGATYGDLGSTSWGDGDGDVSPFCLETCARNEFCGIALIPPIQQCEDDCALSSAQNAQAGMDCQVAFEDLHFCLNTLSCGELETFFEVGGEYCALEEQLVGVNCAP